MEKVIVTGMNGTVAPVLAERVTAAGIDVTAWDRSRTPTNDAESIRRFIDHIQPHGFFHVATGDPEWARIVAEQCSQAGIRFVHTGSVSVFSENVTGPISVDFTPDAEDDYGRYKRTVEEKIWSVNDYAIIARLGWQIGKEPGSNNMIDYLTKTHDDKGVIEASENWIPSTAFLEDTADALLRLMLQYDSGLYHLEGNPGLSFYEIVCRLNKLHGDPWTVTPTAEPRRNNRMLDDRIQVNPITDRLPDG